MTSPPPPQAACRTNCNLLTYRCVSSSEDSKLRPSITVSTLFRTDHAGGDSCVTLTVVTRVVPTAGVGGGPEELCTRRTRREPEEVPAFPPAILLCATNSARIGLTVAPRRALLALARAGRGGARCASRVGQHVAPRLLADWRRRRPCREDPRVRGGPLAWTVGSARCRHSRR